MDKKQRSKCWVCGRVRYKEHLLTIPVNPVILPLFYGSNTIYVCSNFSAGRYSNYFHQSSRESCKLVFKRLLYSKLNIINQVFAELTSEEMLDP